MKKLLMIALFAFPCFSLVGCSDAPTTVEPASEDDGMSNEEYEQYKQQMESGGGGSSRPGN